ncbi:MAG: spore germination protein [Clostridia bacterium]|nr:spore germination protein [Clostridia bacterium]
MENNNLIIKIRNKFNEENQVEELKMLIDGEEFSIFYIDGLINKNLFAAAILSPIEKFKQDFNDARKNTNTKNCESKVNNSKDNGKIQVFQDIARYQSFYNVKSFSDKTDRKTSVNENEIELNFGNQNTDDVNNKSENTITFFEQIKNVISLSGVSEVKTEEEILNNIFSGFAVIVFKDKALSCPILGIEKRGIQEPPSAKVIKGPREGFVEDITTNNVLVRKRLKTPNLKIINLYVGERSKTQISLYYIQDVAKQEIVEKVKKIIESISIDAVIDSYYIVSYLEGDEVKFFKRVGNTEKPDVFCSKILEGRVGIMVDGSPMALTVPFVLIEDLQSAGDYYSTPAFATFTRIMRFIGLVIAILIPGIYVSLQSYNYRILPINFLITLLSSIEGLSVPPLIEILLVLFLFEIISEASVRMPSAMGMALSIIGALALGNTAVDAGIISPPSIVIVAISSVALHIIPDQFDQTRILRILFTVIGGIIGLYGIYVGIIYLITYLCSLESFGVPYLVPYSPSVKSDKKDGFIMKPIQRMKYRPMLMSGKDKVRQGKGK